MSFRLHELDRVYQRRMAVTYPFAALAVTLTLVLIPPEAIIDTRSKVVGYQGPLQVLPEIDIRPDAIEERRLTAAPAGAPPVDFVVIELDYADVPEAEPRPIPRPAPAEVEDTTPEFSPRDDIQTAIRTTGHPILAQSDYELIYMQRPVYPREAINRGVEGEIEILMLVGADGRVDRVHVLNPNQYPLLERAAMEAVNRSLFRAYVVNGKPIPFWVKVPIQFRLIN